MPKTARERFRGPLTAALEARLGLVEPLADEHLAPLLAGPDAALPVPTARERATWTTIDRATRDAVLARVAAERDTPWPTPLAHDAARFHRPGDGDRERWENPAFARQHRLSRAAFAAAVTASDDDLDAVADGVWMLCEQSSWCWPAHDDTFTAHGSVLATVDDPFLDLGAGEVVAQLAWLDHLLGARLDERYPGIRARMRREARIRVFEPFVRRRDWHWLGLDGDVHNWNPWIHGNVLAAALQLLEPDAERLRVVRLAIEGLDRYLAVLPDDGAIDEGYSYWWNGACRALEALDLLGAATRGALDVRAELPALVATVAFPHRMHLGGGWYLNLADGQARPEGDQPWHALHRAARAVGDDAARAHAAAHRAPGAPAVDERHGLGRMLRGITDAAWVGAARERSPLPREVWLPSVEVMLARETAGSAAGLTLAVKGGHNGEHHNHDDVGSFVVASDGVPVLVDAGRPTYTAATFGPERSRIWTMQSSWHNVPEVRGKRQGTGATFHARGTTASADEGGAQFRTELAAAYPDAGVRSWDRSVTLERGGHPRIVVDDAWDFADTGADAPTTLHLLVAGDVELGSGGARIIPIDGATPVRLRWPAALESTTTVRVLDDPMLSSVWGRRLTRIELDVTHHRASRVTVELDTTTTEDPHA